MTFDEKSRRIRERLALALPLRVHCRETVDREWMEMSRLINVTPFGARFTITRPTEPGRLLHLTLPMPRQLRCFDHVEPQYKVWALVRNLKVIPAEGTRPAKYEVGVAFIGKRAPMSFEADPTRRFDVSPSQDKSGLWILIETKLPIGARDPSANDRTDTRHPMAVPVVVEVFDENGNVCASESSVTENISRRGAAVFTSLELTRGSFVRLTSAQYQISVIGAVRGKRVGGDGIMRLHLEFVDRHWPLEELG